LGLLLREGYTLETETEQILSAGLSQLYLCLIEGQVAKRWQLSSEAHSLAVRRHWEV